MMTMNGWLVVTVIYLAIIALGSILYYMGVRFGWWSVAGGPALTAVDYFERRHEPVGSWRWFRPLQKEVEEANARRLAEAVMAANPRCNWGWRWWGRALERERG